MSQLHQPAAQSLPEWLDLATQDLVPSAQTRVRAEIEAHYAEAVEFHRQNGALESAAQAAALVDLGDAATAAKRFGQEHLTTQEVDEFKAIISRANAYEAKSKLETERHPQRAFWRRITSIFANLLWLLSIIWLGYSLHLDLRQFLFLAGSLLALFLIHTSLGVLTLVRILKRHDQLTARQLRSHLNPTWLNLRLDGLIVLVLPFTYAFVLLSAVLSKEFSHSFYFPLILTAGWSLILVRASMRVNRKSQTMGHLYQKLLAAPAERKKLFPASKDNLPPPDASTA